MSKNKSKIIIYWFLVIIWMIGIFVMSNMDSKKSNAGSKGTIDKVVSVVDKGIVNVGIKEKPLSEQKKKELVNKLNFPLRKVVHFTEYFVLCLLLIKALNLGKIKYTYLISLMICFIYALSDELHQLFIMGRSGKFIDVLIDFSGCLMALIIYILLKKINNYKKNKNKVILT